MTTTQLLTILTPTVGLLGILVAWLGHRVVSSNAKLSADISRRNAHLSARLEATKQLAHNRQVWINALREDMALFYALVTEIDRTGKQLNKSFEVGVRIELRLNPDEKDFTALQEAMHQIVNNRNKHEDNGQGRENYIAICQSILKREWDVLKKELKAIDQDDCE